MRGMKDAVNTAQAIAPGNVRSNEARSLVRMNEELFSQKGFIVGRVFEGTCDADGREAAGVANVRVYLEDGRYGVTDENGRFHFEGLEPGTHTVQLDKLTLPDYLELAPCAIAWVTRAATTRSSPSCAPARCGAATSCCARRPRRSGDVQFDFHSALLPDADGDGLAAHEAVVHVHGVPTGNTRAMVMLPDGFEYVPGSATVDGEKVTDARDAGRWASASRSSASPTASWSRASASCRRARTRTFRFETRATPAAGGELPVRAAGACSIRRRSRACARSRSSRS